MDCTVFRCIVASAMFSVTFAGCGVEPMVPGDGGDGTVTENDGAVVIDGDVFPDAVLPDGRVVRGPFATRVVSFEPGEGATFGHNQLPDIVLGPPVGAGDMAGSTDVVSLGRGGRICLGFDDVTVIDGPGVDLLVFENPFIVSGTTEVWSELGEVSVSEDGREYRTFPCVREGPPHPGCAGWNPVYARPDNGISPHDPRHAGGDGFDLAVVGLTRVRFVCIRDLATRGLAPPATGFDLDAVAAVHWTR